MVRLSVPRFPYSSTVGRAAAAGEPATRLALGEEIVRRLRVLLVVGFLALAGPAPAMAQVGAAPTGAWGGLVERVVGWAEGVWRVVAGSEGEAPAGDDADGVALDGPGDTVSFGPPDPGGERFPVIDPDG